jgi:hypothetical protein
MAIVMYFLFAVILMNKYRHIDGLSSKRGSDNTMVPTKEKEKVMGKSFVAIAASAGLLLALAASAEAGNGRTPGQAFAPHGLTNLPSATSHAGFGTTTVGTTTMSTPPGWRDNNGTSSNPGWGATLGGTVPPGLGPVPPGH